MHVVQMTFICKHWCNFLWQHHVFQRSCLCSAYIDWSFNVHV